MKFTVDNKPVLNNLNQYKPINLISHTISADPKNVSKL